MFTSIAQASEQLPELKREARLNDLVNERVRYQTSGTTKCEPQNEAQCFVAAETNL
jgi:hypothetical protein